MKKICIVLIFILGIWKISFSQTKQEQFQGIWMNIMSDPNGEMLIRIVKGINVLSIAHQGEDYIDYYLVETIEGFINVEDFETINVKDFDINGKYYLSVFKDDVKLTRIQKKGYMMRSELYFEDDKLIIEGGKLAEYTRLECLSSMTLRLLYKRGKKDNRNYLKEYINIDVTEVVSSKSTIYSEPDKPTKMYLVKGDVVTVLEEKEGWIKMEYEGKKLITGWIKKKDTK
jgi:hypothetical protein